MTFDARDVRVGMDVFTSDGVYLGTVRRVVFGPLVVRPRPVSSAEGSRVSGERLGPQPTGPLGNPGPTTQSARQGYASAPDDAVPLGAGTFLVGRLPIPLGWRRIPLRDVQVVSLERVVLARSAAELDFRVPRRRAH